MQDQPESSHRSEKLSETVRNGEQTTTADRVPEIKLGRYRTVPELAGEQFEALRESIRIHGVCTPIDVDEDGYVIDGDARVRAARELGIHDYPVRVWVGLSEEEKRDLSLRLNCNRRQLAQKQRAEIIRGELKRDPARSSRTLAEVCGTSHRTVQTHRKELEQAGEIGPLTQVTGQDGKTYPARKPQKPVVEVPDAGHLSAVQENLGELDPAEISGGDHSADEVARLAAAKRNRVTKRAEQVAAAEAPEEQGDRPERADTGHIDLIVAGPASPDGSPTDYFELATLAARVLRPGAPLAVTIPKPDLADAMVSLGDGLEYTWSFAQVLAAETPVADPIPVEERWHLTLLFRKLGRSHKQSLVTDLVVPDGGECGHPTLLHLLIRAYTHPGDTVLAASTDEDVAAACVELGRTCVSDPADAETESGGGQTGGTRNHRLGHPSPVWTPDTTTDADAQLTIEWETPDVVAIRRGGIRVALLPVERVAKSRILKPDGNDKIDHAGIANPLANICGRSELPHFGCDRPCFADEEGRGGCYANCTRWSMRRENVAVGFDVTHNGIINDRATVRWPNNDDWSLEGRSHTPVRLLQRVACESADGAAAIALGLIQNYAAANPHNAFFTYCSHAFRPSDESLAELAALPNVWCLHTLSGWFSESESDVRFASFERYLRMGIPSVAYIVTSETWDNDEVLSRTLDLVPPELVIEEPRRLSNSAQETPLLNINPLGCCSQSKCSECPLKCGYVPLLRAGLLGGADAAHDLGCVTPFAYPMEVEHCAN